MSTQYIFTMHRLNRVHPPDKHVLKDVTLAFLPGAKIGVVGPNGAGKSSVLKIMAGWDQPSNGEAQLAPGAAVGLLAQEPVLDETKDVRGNVEQAVAETRALLKRFDEVSAAMGEPDADFDALLAEQGDLMEKIDHRNAWELDSTIEMAMDALRCPPGEAEVPTLSGGERRRVALCQLLLQQPDLLLLDEPTNHLDIESMEVLEGAIESFDGTAILISHDRYLLDRLCDRIIEVRDGEVRSFDGGYDDWIAAKAAV
jgi:ATPase subunit of ABC transporter with duplicated ATPase domains